MSGAWGFGDPVVLVEGDELAPPPVDVGFGEIDPGAGLLYQPGFGDQDGGLARRWATALAVVGDEGGELVRVRADFPTAGPWRVQLVGAFEGQVFPQDRWGCLAPFVFGPLGVVKERQDEWGCVASGGVLWFVTCAAPPGLYDVLCRAQGLEVRFAAAVRVVTQAPCAMTRPLRASFPERVFHVGPLWPARQTWEGYLG